MTPERACGQPEGSPVSRLKFTQAETNVFAGKVFSTRRLGPVKSPKLPGSFAGDSQRLAICDPASRLLVGGA
jgi:hypothetical protein